MLRRRKGRFLADHDEDPMAGSANLVDAMLVLAVGFLIFVTISWNMSSVIFSAKSPQEKQDLMNAIQQTVAVNMGQELNETPPINSSSGSGYVPMGTVYRDPATGKLYLIQG